jgi:stage III sporulation protein AE
VEGNSLSEEEAALTEAVNETFNKIDFGDLSNASIFGGGNFINRIGEILSGKFQENYPDIFSGIMALIGGAITEVLPIVVLITAITILCGFVNTAKSSDGGVGDIIYFVAYSAVVLIVVGSVADVTAMVGQTIGSIKTQTDILFPIILTLMVASGANVSAGVYQPAVAVLSAGIMQIFSAVIMPIFIISFAFSVAANLAQNTKCDKFVGFFNSLFKWLIGICFTVFLAFFAVQGITAGSFDSVSIRAAKMTVSSAVPIVGGYLSQGFDLIMASSSLIKNAVGAGGIFMLLSIALAPLLKMIFFSLAIKLASAVTQPVADSRISNFLTSINKCFSQLISCLLGVTFMYFITLSLLITTGNYI